MASHDMRGNPVGSDVAAARQAAERALWRMMSFYATPLSDMDQAVAADPGWAFPHVMKAGYLLGLTEPSLCGEAAALIARARALSAGAPAREQAHLEAVQELLEGRWHAACRRWDDLLLEHPRDALALQWAHLWDFYRGDAAHLRLRPGRALPDWDDDDPLRPFVLGLYAFGLEESNLFAQAEEAGRQALQSDPRVPWAVHAVAHVMEMQGRFEEGSAWLRQNQPHWAEGNGFAGHLWWHEGLFRLEALDVAGVLRLIDDHLGGQAVTITLQRVDAVSLLWRLHLLNQNVSERAAALLAGWPDDHTAGYYAFNDVHRLLALLAAGEHARAEVWLAHCAERALDPADARRANHRVAHEVGLPLMRGLLALERGAADEAADAIHPLRARMRSFGGSHAQRDLVDQTLLAAAARCRRGALGRALISERLMAKPATPLTRHWMERIGILETARS